MNKGPSGEFGPVRPRMKGRGSSYIGSPGVPLFGGIILRDKDNRVINKPSQTRLPQKIGTKDGNGRKETTKETGLLLKEQAPWFGTSSPFPQQEQSETYDTENHGLTEACA